MDQVRTIRPEVEVEIVEVFSHPARAVKDGVFMIPAIRIGRRRWFTPPTLDVMLAALDEA